MTVPHSILSQFPGIPKARFRGCLIGTEGGPNTGKTEFPLSGPGPILVLAADKQYRGMMDNPSPPETRTPDFHVQPVEMAMSQGVTQDDSLTMWKTFYNKFYLPALAHPDIRTVVVDGDSDTFECQMMAAFGRTTQIPQIQRTGLNAARRLYISRAATSGKIVVMSNKLKKKYEKQWDAAGNPVPDPQKPNEQLATWDGLSYDRQGFNDYEYCYEIQLRHLYKKPYLLGTREISGQWGIKLLMVKANRSLEGDELWGGDCNMPSLLGYIYPHIDLAEWGY